MIHFPKLTQEEQKPFIELADKMMNLKKQYPSANTPTERKLLQKQIEYTDKKINELVYEFI